MRKDLNCARRKIVESLESEKRGLAVDEGLWMRRKRK